MMRHLAISGACGTVKPGFRKIIDRRLSMVAVFLALALVVSAAGAQSPPSATHVDVAEAVNLLESDKNIVILDVRTPWEYRGGHLDGAININYLSFGFASRISALDPDTRYLVHCKSGHRSARALKSLQKAGIEKLIHLDGGIDAWKSAGLPVNQ